VSPEKQVLHHRRERLVSRRGARPEGVAAVLGNGQRGQDAHLRRALDPRHVRVPGIGTRRALLGVLDHLERLVAAEHLDDRVHAELAEAPREGEMRRVVHRLLAAQEDHLVAEQGVVQLGELLLGERLR
jgi:hypothetical protein